MGVDVLVDDKDGVGLLARTPDTSDLLVGRIRRAEDLVRLQVALLLLIVESESLDRVPLLAAISCKRNRLAVGSNGNLSITLSRSILQFPLRHPGRCSGVRSSRSGWLDTMIIRQTRDHALRNQLNPPDSLLRRLFQPLDPPNLTQISLVGSQRLDIVGGQCNLRITMAETDLVAVVDITIKLDLGVLFAVLLLSVVALAQLRICGVDLSAGQVIVPLH